LFDHPSASLSIPQHPSPSLTIPHHPSPSLTIPHHPSPSLTIPHHPSPSLTIPHHPSPSLSSKSSELELVFMHYCHCYNDVMLGPRTEDSCKFAPSPSIGNISKSCKCCEFPSYNAKCPDLCLSCPHCNIQDERPPYFITSDYILK
jgi:hypothetical protein